MKKIKTAMKKEKKSKRQQRLEDVLEILQGAVDNSY